MPDVTLPQGTIHYRDTGEGPPVVFVHGLLVDGTRLSDCLAAMPLDEGVRRDGPPLRLPASPEHR